MEEEGTQMYLIIHHEHDANRPISFRIWSVSVFGVVAAMAIDGSNESMGNMSCRYGLCMRRGWIDNSAPAYSSVRTICIFAVRFLGDVRIWSGTLLRSLWKILCGSYTENRCQPWYAMRMVFCSRFSSTSFVVHRVAVDIDRDPSQQRVIRVSQIFYGRRRLSTCNMHRFMNVRVISMSSTCSSQT